MSKLVLTEEQLDLLVQNELNRNRRAFRLMESDREAYPEEVMNSDVHNIKMVRFH